MCKEVLTVGKAMFYEGVLWEIDMIPLIRKLGMTELCSETETERGREGYV